MSPGSSWPDGTVVFDRKCEPVKTGEQGEIACQMADKTVATLVARVRRLLQCTALALYGCASGAAQFLNAASCE